MLKKISLILSGALLLFSALFSVYTYAAETEKTDTAPADTTAEITTEADTTCETAEEYPEEPEHKTITVRFIEGGDELCNHNFPDDFIETIPPTVGRIGTE